MQAITTEVENSFKVFGFVIDNRLENLRSNFGEINGKVESIIKKWIPYHLTIHGRLTIAKTMILSQYTYFGMIMDILDINDYEYIQNVLSNFILNNTSFEASSDKKRGPWIKDDVLYGDVIRGGFNMIKVEDFITALKAGWMRRYIRGIDDHWADILDNRLKLDQGTRITILDRGSEHPGFNDIIKEELPCLSGIIRAYKKVVGAFAEIKENNDTRWHHGSIFYNPSFLLGF